MKTINFQHNGEWYTGGVGKNGAFYAKAQKGKREFMTADQLVEASESIKVAINKAANRTKTSDSAVAKELGALATELLGDEAEG